MQEITRTVRGQTATHVVYTQEEADAAGIPYRCWEETLPGEWGCTDDGYVGELLKLDRYPRKGRPNRVGYLYTFSFGRKWVTRKEPHKARWKPTVRPVAPLVGTPQLEAAPFLEHGTHYMTAPHASWLDQEMTRERFKRAVTLFATLTVASEKGLGGREWTEIAKAYRPDQAVPVATVKRLFKYDRVRDMAYNKIAALLNNRGIDMDSILQNYLTIHRMAMEGEKPNLSAALAATDRLAALVERAEQEMNDREEVEDADYELIEQMTALLDEPASEAP